MSTVRALEASDLFVFAGAGVSFPMPSNLPVFWRVTAEQVLGRLEDGWLDRLRADVSGRTVVFVGYSGNDLDFRPVWDDVLQAAAHVVWFDRDDPVAQARKRVLLRRVAAAGRLEFPPCRPVAGHPPNPSYDFVPFCVGEHLVSVGVADLDALLESPGPTAWPPFEGRSAISRAPGRSCSDRRDADRAGLRRYGRCCA